MSVAKEDSRSKRVDAGPPAVAATGTAAAIERGRDCYGRRAWAEAHRWLSQADADGALAVPDLERLAWSANLIGQVERFVQLMERLYQLHLDGGEEARAARCAFWLSLRLSVMNEKARASGWLARAQRLAEGKDCVERGYLLIPQIHRYLRGGDYQAAHDAAAAAAEIGDQFGEADLGAFARSLQGRVLLRQGRIEGGFTLLDEAMVAVTVGELGPIISGLIYCTAIAGCHEVYAMGRSREWTAALAGWCAAQPELVPFSGRCLVHRAELMQLGGDWPEAIDEARRASERCASTVDPGTVADSFYQQAEVHRLRGDFEAAEHAYRGASELGREAQPGLALLRLAQGRGAAAASAIRGVLQTTTDRLQRARLLPAAVEIAIGAGDIEEARRAAGELEGIAKDFDTEVLAAMADHARGAVELAAGNAEAALAPLRRAFRVWNDVGAPYIAARLRVVIARACRALGDGDTATRELDLAREVFERLGAGPELAAVGAAGARSPDTRGPDTRGPGTDDRRGLSMRELEVLRLVASGKTNKVIARELFLSEKTIDRHVSNIFTKVDVASRAAATAYAYEHGLVSKS